MLRADESSPIMRMIGERIALVMDARIPATEQQGQEGLGFQNSFCVLGLSTDAEGVMIQQASQRSLMERRLGTKSSTTDTEIQMIERAAELLRDPMQRFYASMHWVTLTGDERSGWGQQAEIRALAFNKTLVCGTAYDEVATASSLILRTHNRAVLASADAHRLASMGDLDGAAKAWSSGFSLWSICLSSEEFLSRQLARAKAIDDPRLTPSLVRKEVAAIPRRLMLQVANLAATALDRRETNHASRLVKIIADAPFENAEKDSVLEAVYGPIAHRVVTEVDSLSDRLEKLVGDRDEVAADEIRPILEQFNREVAPDLEQMLSIGDLPGLAEEHARDHASRFLQTLGLNAWNLASDASLASAATEQAARFADAGNLKRKLIESVAAIKDQPLLSAELDTAFAMFGAGKALEAINHLKAVLPRLHSEDSSQFVNQMIDKILDAYSIKLTNEATEMAQRRRSPADILAKLRLASSYARSDENKRQIAGCIAVVELKAQTGQSSSSNLGCILTIVGLIGIVALIVFRNI
jgi:hypothetical protein